MAARAVLLRLAWLGQDLSPQLSWGGAPDGIQGHAVTVCRPDAPTGSGFWCGAVADVPAPRRPVAELPKGAGDGTGSQLHQGVCQLPNDARVADCIGAAPPAGHDPHRYFVVAHALDILATGVPVDTAPADLGFTMAGHTPSAAPC